MGIKARGMFTRKRLRIVAIAVVTTGGVLLACVYVGRFVLARWAVARALSAGGLEPATFQIASVGMNGVRVEKLVVGKQPWLAAERIDVALSLGGLIAARADAIHVTGARWTIQYRDSAVHWGYVPSGGNGTGALDLHCDLVEVSDSRLEIAADGSVQEVPLSVRLTPAGPGAIKGEVNAAWQGRTAAALMNVKSEDGMMTIQVDGHAAYEHGKAGEASGAAGPVNAQRPPEPRAGWHATMVRRKDGSAELDADLTLDSIAEQVGESAIALARGNIKAHATVSGGEIAGLNATVHVEKLRAGKAVLESVDLKADKAAESVVQLELAMKGEGWEVPGVGGSVRWETAGEADAARSLLLIASMQTQRPLVFDFESAGISGGAGALAADATVRVDSAGYRLMDGRVSMEGGSLVAGDLALSDGRALAETRDGSTIDVTQLTAAVSDGGVVAAEPFSWNMGDQRVGTFVTLSNMSLAHWLPIITSNHAKGEGRTGGRVEVAVDWSSGSMKLTELKGMLQADPPHGYIQAADAEALGALLEKQDPRFATDEVMRPVRDKIIAALHDFAFHKLSVDLSRVGNRTIALTSLSGFGRHGEDPQGLNLTLDLQAQDSFVDLASRIAAKSRMNKQARSALEDFFQDAPGARENR